jgi:hypothetical protein
VFTPTDLNDAAFNKWAPNVLDISGFDLLDKSPTLERSPDIPNIPHSNDDINNVLPEFGPCEIDDRIGPIDHSAWNVWENALTPVDAKMLFQYMCESPHQSDNLKTYFLYYLHCYYFFLNKYFHVAK